MCTFCAVYQVLACLGDSVSLLPWMELPLGFVLKFNYINYNGNV